MPGWYKSFDLRKSADKDGMWPQSRFVEGPIEGREIMVQLDKSQQELGRISEALKGHGCIRRVPPDVQGILW